MLNLTATPNKEQHYSFFSIWYSITLQKSKCFAKYTVYSTSLETTAMNRCTCVVLNVVILCDTVNRSMWACVIYNWHALCCLCTEKQRVCYSIEKCRCVWALQFPVLRMSHYDEEDLTSLLQCGVVSMHLTPWEEKESLSLYLSLCTLGFLLEQY